MFHFVDLVVIDSRYRPADCRAEGAAVDVAKRGQGYGPGQSGEGQGAGRVAYGGDF